MLRKLFLSSVLTFGLVSTSALADDMTTDNDVVGRPMVFVTGGGHNSILELRNTGDNLDLGSNFNTGFNVGGGLGVQLNRWAALRAKYNFARSQGERSALTPIAGNHFNRHYYGADLQFRGNTTGGFSPYLFVGGGAVTISPGSDAVLLSPVGTTFSHDNFTNPAGTAGIGFEYQVPNSGFGIYAEGAGWGYKWDRYGFDRTQVDTNWGGGLTYRFGY